MCGICLYQLPLCVTFYIRQRLSNFGQDRCPCASSPAASCHRATLVICPVVAIIQWRQEIARYTTPGALKVFVYHGAKRNADPKQMAAADVVLTTYSTIENEYRR